MEDIKTKVCRKCGETKPTTEFYRNKNAKDGLQPICKDCDKKGVRERVLKNPESRAAYQKQYRLDHLEELREYDHKRWFENYEEESARQKAIREQYRKDFLDMYGGCCALCDPSDPDAWNPEFLTLDHVNGGGCAERREHDDTYRAYRDAIKDGVPDFTKYRILCHNHNQAVGHRSGGPFAGMTVELRNTVLSGYGAVCSCCGQTEVTFLQLDHVSGGGNKHIKMHGGTAHYKDAIKRGFPDDYQILCANCNNSKHRGNGLCVHQREGMMEDGGNLGRANLGTQSTSVGPRRDSVQLSCSG